MPVVNQPSAARLNRGPLLFRYIDDPEQYRIERYLEHGGYTALRKALREMTPAQVAEMVARANLRGRGGAFFPTARKWSLMPSGVFPRYVVANADESEPGTCKDRQLMERDPHQLIEGLTLAAYSVGAEQVYIYIRWEFEFAAERLWNAIREAYAHGFLGKRILGTEFNCDMAMHRGAGAYICGEETALLSSLEGRRPEPRLRPPYFPAAKGYRSLPTALSNVETYCNVTHIVREGPEVFTQFGREKCPGTKLTCISGHVRTPGVYEIPLGVPLREVIDEWGGGVREGRSLKAVIPGGASAPILPPDRIDYPFDFEGMIEAGSMIGSAGVIVMDDTTCMVGAAMNLVRFFEHESCGKCTPCREGCPWLSRLLRKIEAGQGKREDIDLLLSLCDEMDGKCFCLLGESAIVPVRSAIQHWRHEFEQHITEGRCPFGDGAY
ncbi:MAG: NADH-quinone oxidoreductase subunit NuoF [Armatimonadetes bacterium]|nr:NADH-quinone oxidoreductase subunit NuoF [Armatimonadota bacterium]